MYKIYELIQGKKRTISLPEDSLLNQLIQEFNFPFDLELNLCLFGNLGNELFLDPRLEDKLKNEDKERLNKIVVGKTFNELRLCYACYLNEVTLTIKTILHELHHFQDIFESSTDYKRPVEGGGEYINTTGFIKNSICTHLNDFYAEYYATKRLIDLYDIRVKGINLFSIINLNLGYIENNEKHTKEKIQEILAKEVSDFEKQLAIIYFIQHYIIKQVLYFLANYRAFQEKGFSNQLYEDHWDKFISNEIKPKMAKLLIKIKKKIMDENLNLLELSSKLRDYLNDIIFDFYHLDFKDYISEMLEIRPKYSPFSFIQDFTRSINLRWIDQIQNLIRNINMGWVEQLQELNKTLVEPFRQISALARSFNNLIPSIGLNIEEEDGEENENDKDCNSD